MDVAAGGGEVAERGVPFRAVEFFVVGEGFFDEAEAADAGAAEGRQVVEEGVHGFDVGVEVEGVGTVQ